MTWSNRLYEVGIYLQVDWLLVVMGVAAVCIKSEGMLGHLSHLHMLLSLNKALLRALRKDSYELLMLRMIGGCWEIRARNSHFFGLYSVIGVQSWRKVSFGGVLNVYLARKRTLQALLREWNCLSRLHLNWFQEVKSRLTHLWLIHHGHS